MKIKLLLFLTLLIVQQVHAQVIKLNQTGFYPNAKKVAVVPGAPAGNFQIVSPDGNTVYYTGTLSNANTWSYSNESVRLADFSSFTTPGQYQVKVNGTGTSYTFKIGDNVMDEIARGALKAYYFIRCSEALTSDYAGVYARKLGHPDTQVFIHSSAASTARPTGTKISAPKGWYDAGDYNKYIVNSGISTYTILALYEHYPDYFNQLNLTIPESSNNLPDILDQALWNIEWMLAMQDPNDGGVYHKLTTKQFCGFIMPAEDTATRYVVMKTTSAALDFAAVMAVTYRIFSNFESQKPGFATQCLNAAIAAWNWAKANPNVSYVQPADIGTGTYGDNNFSDEFDWASTELYIATLDESYLTYSGVMSSTISIPSWQNVEGLAWVSLGFHRNNLTAAASKTIIENNLLSLGNTLYNSYSSSAYGVTMGSAAGDFTWGSNSVAANQILMLMQAFNINKDSNYLDAAISNLDYLLGRNATGYSFMTGFGDKTPMHPHHRISQADGITNPVPGLMAGGPNTQRPEQNCSYTANLPATCYLDNVCSYSTNEIAINWNAPLAYAAGSIEATLGNGHIAPYITTQPVSKTIVAGNTISLFVAAGGSDTLEYQWARNGIAISGANTPSITFNLADSSDSGNYTVTITNTYGSTISDTAVISVVFPRPYGGSPHPIPGTFQAEDYDIGGQGISYFDSDSGNTGGAYRNGYVDIEATTDAGGGYDVGWTVAGEYLKYTVDVAATGYYDFIFRTANGSGAAGAFNLLSGTDTIIPSTSAPVTGGYQKWTNVTVNKVYLQKGRQIFTFDILSGGFNLNYVTATAEPSDCAGMPGGNFQTDSCGRCLATTDSSFNAPCVVTAISNAATGVIYLFPNPFQESFSIDLRNLGSGSSTLTLLTSSGTMIFSEQVPNGQKTEINQPGLKPGFYLVKISTGNQVKVYNLIKY